MNTQNLPNISELSYFRKTKIEGKDIIILKPKDKEKYRVIFDCPKCGYSNDYEEELKIVKHKNEKFFVVTCKKCSTSFEVVQLKAR